MKTSRIVLALFSIITLTASAAYAQQTFTQTVTRENRSCNATCSVLDVPELNGNPSAIIFVTPAEGTKNLNPHPIGAYYMYLKKWSIYNVDGVAITDGAKYNVQYYANPDSDRFVYITPERGGDACIDHAGLNGNPNAQIRFFPTGTPGKGSLFNRDETKVEYNAAASKWCISNINGNAVTSDSAYNVMFSGGGPAIVNPIADKKVVAPAPKTVPQQTPKIGDGIAPISDEPKDDSAVAGDLAAAYDSIEREIELSYNKLKNDATNNIDELTTRINKLKAATNKTKEEMEKMDAMSAKRSEFEQIFQKLEQDKQTELHSVQDQKGKAILQAGTSTKPISSAAAPDTTAIEWFRLVHDYETKAAAVDAKYTGRTIRAIGPFESSEMDEGQMIIWFATPVKAISHCGCYLQKSQKELAADLKRGQMLVVEGTFEAIAGRLILKNCVVK